MLKTNATDNPPPQTPKQSTLLLVVFCTTLNIFEILKLYMVEEQ